MSSVTIKNVRKNYGTLEVVHGINLTIEDGSFVVLLGPSGCGKSTLLRLVAGLETPTTGEIRLDGTRIVGDGADLAMVVQNYALYAHMKVRDNMSFSLILAKRPKAEIDEKVAWAAKILNLEPYLDRYPRELSGGQRQRVAMGRAIVRNPAVFLFDEPLSNLDAKLRVQMRTEIKELHDRLKTTTVYVTHDQIEAMTMADKIVILRDGNIEQEGSPLEVYDKPANLFVAEFIGSPSMNLLKGEVTSNGVLLGEGTVLPLPPVHKASIGQKVVYGIRPEHFTFGSGAPAKVVVVEPTGPEMHIYADMGGQEICAITQDRVSLARDETFHLMPRLDKVHLFDAASGKALV